MNNYSSTFVAQTRRDICPDDRFLYGQQTDGTNLYQSMTERSSGHKIDDVIYTNQFRLGLVGELPSTSNPLLLDTRVVL